MSDLAGVLRRRFPNAVLSWQDTSDIILEDVGQGQYIAKWNEKKLGPIPTEKQLEDFIARDVPPSPPTKTDMITTFLATAGLTVADLKTELSK